jgi:predicted site-specific integrase-resolvase
MQKKKTDLQNQSQWCQNIVELFFKKIVISIASGWNEHNANKW